MVAKILKLIPHLGVIDVSRYYKVLGKHRLVKVFKICEMKAKYSLTQ